MDLDSLDETPEPQRRDLDEDIAAFEQSDRGMTRRAEAWETLAAPASARRGERGAPSPSRLIPSSRLSRPRRASRTSRA